MINFFITSQYLSILLVPIIVYLLLNYKKCKLQYALPIMGALAVYSVVPHLPIEKSIKVNISIVALSIIIAADLFRHISPYLKNASLSQQRRALKKLPILVMVIFYTGSNFFELPVSYALVGFALVLCERSLRIAFFTWPFLLVNFFESSVIIEWTIILSQTVSIFLVKERNE